MDVEEESDKNSRNLGDKTTFKTNISLNTYFLNLLWMDVSHFNYKIYIVTLNVIVYVEAHLYIMLHNDFEKIPNVIIIKFGYNARCHWLKERAL